MVMSMTGFAQASHEAEWGTLAWELRSVNHRYLEPTIRLPDNLRALEMPVRERLQAQLSRGKVDAVLRFVPGAIAPFDFILNEALLAQLAQATDVVHTFFPDAKVDALDILKFQGVLEIQQAEFSGMQTEALRLLEQALGELMQARQREGRNIQACMQMCLQKVQEFVKVIAQQLPVWREQAQAKWQARFAELAMDVNRDRLEQELVWLLQKADVAEELQRLDSHLQEVERVLQSSQPKGRRLDFLMQELNREANTLGSKSLDSEVTQLVVEIKVLIEQMREQVQNIE